MVMVGDYQLNSAFSGLVWTLVRKQDGKSVCLQGDDAVEFCDVFEDSRKAEAEWERSLERTIGSYFD